MTARPERPEYHLLPKHDPALAVEILRAAAGIDPRPPVVPEADQDAPG